MNFIRGVLARARGELARIRPRRDFADDDSDPAIGIAVAIDDDPVNAAAPRERWHEDVAFVEPARVVQPRAGAGMEPTRLAAPHRAPSVWARAPGQDEGDHESEHAPLDPRATLPLAPTPMPGERAANPPAALAHDIEHLSPSAPRKRADAEVPRAPLRHAESARPQPAPGAPGSPTAPALAPLQIDIHIGRVEVAPPPAPCVTSVTNGAVRTPRLTLADYLAQRSAKR
ncbi:hypothetical protein [Paraburkholderia sp. JHI869]|uniref:hypothetical protein n=1 Tax=Paraburkholderia sp. JHI869 TaxID=3112959 RepID=UPI003176B2F4